MTKTKTIEKMANRDALPLEVSIPPVVLGFNHDPQRLVYADQISTIGQCLAGLLIIQQIFLGPFLWG